MADEGMGWRINFKQNTSLRYSLSLRYVFASIHGSMGDYFPSPGPGCRELLMFSCLNLFKSPWDLLVLVEIHQLIHNHLSMFPRREHGSASCLGWAGLQRAKAGAEPSAGFPRAGVGCGLDFYENNLYHIDTFAYFSVSFWKEREMGSTASDRSRFLLHSSAFLPTFRNPRKPVMS